MMSAVTPSKGLIDATTEIFHSSIPVVNINEFENISTRKTFLEDLEKALRVGFFAVVNPEIDVKTIQEGYEAFDRFFALPTEEKKGIYHPETNGQRGYVPGETALHHKAPDCKEYVHIGSHGNYWPKHFDLEGPAMGLYNKMKDMGQPLLKAIALLLGEREDFLIEKTKNGENLLRALHYFKNPKDGLWAGEHTDIDLLTILPYASEKGLEVEIDGKWVPIKVPKNALVVNVGDMLEAFSNGRWSSCKHRVISNIPDTERWSIVFFIHPSNDTVIGPLCREGAIYPTGLRLEYLFLRLFSLKTLSKENAKGVIEGDFIKRIEFLVDENRASESVKRWYLGFQKSLELFKQGNA